MIKVLNIYVLLFNIVPSILGSQVFHNQNWVLGYDTSSLDQVGNAILFDFNTAPLTVSTISSASGFGMEGANTSLSDRFGNLLFYSNGCKILNKEHVVMTNGDTINPGQIQNMFCPYGGSPHVQGVLALPHPQHDSISYVFNLNDEYVYNFPDWPRTPTKLFFQTIDMTKASGLGEVILKNEIAIQDTFSRGNISATRHSNGKDWWLIVPKSHSSCYWIIPITGQGVGAPKLNCLGSVWPDNDWSCQTLFTPNSQTYIRNDAYSGFSLFDFDATVGELSNARTYMMSDTTNGVGGAAVSPSSQFLYITALKKVYQFDLWQADIMSTKTVVGEYDGFFDPFPSIFHLAALAPDNRVYVSSTSSHRHLHVINYPDCPGLKCDFRNHSMLLPSYNFASIPNMPHYWSQASNVNCDSVSSAVSQDDSYTGPFIYPNPTNRSVTIDLASAIESSEIVHLQVFDNQGRVLIEFSTYDRNPQIDLAGLNNGIYYVRIYSGGSIHVSSIIKAD
jgi:hypothetical protein